MESENKPKTSLPSPGSTRFTRSKVVPDWTVGESLILVSEIALVNKDCLKALSSYQKWKMISDNCAALGLVRSSMQCRRKWELILPEYRKIKEWEVESFQSGSGNSYWCLESESKKKCELPDSFDKQLFESIDDLHEAHEGRLDSDLDSDPEALVSTIEAGMLDVKVDSGPKKQRWRETKEHEILTEKLCEDAQLIHAILKTRGDLTENTSTIPPSLDLKKIGKPNTDFARRRQGDELIKVLGNLADTLEQFAMLVKESA